MTIELDEVPPNSTELLVRSACHLPGDIYHFPEESFQLQGGLLQYTMSGALRFDSPQSEESRPIDLKLLVQARGNEVQQEYDLLGTPALSIRVVTALAGPRPAPASSHSIPDTEPTTSTRLTAEEESEQILHRYRGRVNLDITAGQDKRRSVVRVGELDVSLTDADYKAFMLLVLGAFVREGGWVPLAALRTGAGLALEGQFFPQGIDQALKRLRDKFRPALGDLSGTEFLERSGDGRARLSIHPAYLRWDRAVLMSHRVEEVREIGKLLPASR